MRRGCGSPVRAAASSRRWMLVTSDRALPRPHHGTRHAVLQGLPRLHLQRLRQPPRHGGGPERRAGSTASVESRGPPAVGRRGADRHGDQCRAGRTPRANREAAAPRPTAAEGRAEGAAHRVPDMPKGRLLDGAAPSMRAGAPAQAAGGMSTESITNTVAFAVGMLPQSTMFPLTSGASGVPVISTMSPCALTTEPAATRPWAS